ncbi:MAG: sulfotransferase, partial [Devosia sp.]
NALRLKPNDTQAFFGLALNTKYAARDNLLGTMGAMHSGKGVGGIDYESLCFALAKVFDDLGEPSRAMEYAIEANGLISRPFDLGAEQRNLDDLRRMATADAFSRLPIGDPSPKPPLLIVGMNRSGTTLVESILSRHPSVLAQGEVGDWPQLEGRLLNRMRAAGRPAGRNAALTALNREWMNQRAGELRALTDGRASGSYSIAIDKFPDNALRLGLVSRVFPNARIVHVRRHPLDVGLSNYFRRFTTGQGFAFRMDWIGAKVRLVADSMALWKKALDLPILDVSYERLVADPEGESRRLIAFAGLEWDDACLTPSKTQRSVLTASQWQVRQPIYTGSVSRWRRYEPWLAPMIEAMGGMEWIEQEMADQASLSSLSANRS